jgi:hypothetical protein
MDINFQPLLSSNAFSPYNWWAVYWVLSKPKGETRPAVLNSRAYIFCKHLPVIFLFRSHNLGEIHINLSHLHLNFARPNYPFCFYHHQPMCSMIKQFCGLHIFNFRNITMIKKTLSCGSLGFYWHSCEGLKMH